MPLRVLSIAACWAAAHAAGHKELGEHSFCDNDGRHHSIKYDTTLGVELSEIYELDTLTGLKAVQCDIDGSRLKVDFHNGVDSLKYWTEWHIGNAFLSGLSKFGCPLKDIDGHVFVLRRVLGAKMDGATVIVETGPAQYDEVYSDASISYSSKKDSQACGSNEVDKPVCVGVNVDKTSCTTAAKPLPIFNKGPVGLTCDNCFLSLKTDVFFNVQIKGFKLQLLQAGFHNSTMQSTVDFDMQATKSWSLGIDKDKMVFNGEDNPVVSFKIGPVPFIFWFDVDMHVVGDVNMQASAEAKAGVQMKFDIGDDFVTWDPKNKWTHTEAKIKETITPTISGKADFNGQANLQVIPTLGMHVNNMFSYKMTFGPTLSMAVTGSTEEKKLCETTNYDLELSKEAELHLNVDWAFIHENKVWGPTKIWSKSGQLSQACAPAAPTEVIV